VIIGGAASSGFPRFFDAILNEVNLLSARRALAASVALVAALAGGLTALHYHYLGLTLSHYDSRGHLIVARRIFDNITPGWQQIGAVWLPLPHLLNALPVQIDANYQTGASAVILSVLSFAAATGAIAWIVQSITASAPAGVAAAAVFGLNPNVLYLQATPMTEPLLFALTTIGVAMLMEWSKGQAGQLRQARVAGGTLALACLTRYEAWIVTAVALTAAVWAAYRRGRKPLDALRAVAAVAVYPAVAIAGFCIFSRVVIGQWFVPGDFFVPENKALGLPLLAAAEIGWGTQMLSGGPLFWVGVAGVALLAAIGLFDRDRPEAMIALSLIATAALPWSAFIKGHPFRIRYMVPLIVIEAIGAGTAAGVWRRTRAIGAIAVVGVAAFFLRPVDASAPMVVEAQWDRPNVSVRATVTACIGAPRAGDTIMASMGSLGHYMQETSRAGFRLRDFLHEGNGDIWLAAIQDPRPFAEWIVIEEKAQGGDALAHLAREHPHFLDGYSRVCDGAGLALYRRGRSADQNLKLSVNR
jgi:hypothetical protein